MRMLRGFAKSLWKSKENSVNNIPLFPSFVGSFKILCRVLKTFYFFFFGKTLMTLSKQTVSKGIHSLFSLLQFLVICQDQVSDLENCILQNCLEAFWKFLPLPVIIYHSNFCKGLHITINIATISSFRVPIEILGNC